MKWEDDETTFQKTRKRRQGVVIQMSTGSAERACGGKGSYRRRIAIAVLNRRRNAVQDEELVIYRCKHCGRWHLGHTPKTMRAPQIAMRWT